MVEATPTLQSVVNMFYGMLLLIGVTGAAGDVLLYRWATEHHNGWLAAALSIWAFSLVLFGLLIRWGGRTLGLTFVLAAVVHTALILSWDIATSSQRLSRMEWVGLTLAVLGVLLIELAQHSSQANK